MTRVLQEPPRHGSAVPAVSSLDGRLRGGRAYGAVADASRSAILRARIESGEYPAGRALPSRARLEQETGLSRNTIMRSIRVLADEGLVTRRQGWGTFVLAPGERRA
jgi:GntR family transcriptional regulator